MSVEIWLFLTELFKTESWLLGHSIEICQWKWTQQKWPSRSQYVTRNYTFRQATYNSVLVFHCNYVSILHHFWDIMIYFPKFMRSRDPEHIPFGVICVNQYTAFASPIPKIWWGGGGAKIYKTGHMTLTMPIRGSLSFHPKANTWYILWPVYKSWWLSFQPFRGYNHERQHWKWVIMWPWPRLF